MNSAPGVSGVSDLDSLFCAISDAMEALTAWNIEAFQAASERQREICERLAITIKEHRAPGTEPQIRELRELNQVYDRLLQHSVHWTRTIRAVLQSSGHSPAHRSSVHFRG